MEPIPIRIHEDTKEALELEQQTDTLESLSDLRQRVAATEAQIE